jgi:Domain of unknown function (DUF4136)
MKIKLGIVGAVILTALCVAAQEVKTYYDHAYDFSQVKTFAVKIGTPWGNPTNEEYAKDEVAKQLTAKGWTQTPDESSANVLVVIHGATQDKKSLESFYSGTGVGNYGWAGPAGVTSTREVEYRVGTGVVDIFDTKTKKLLFRGVGEDQISQKGEKNQKKIENGIEKMFTDFPPKPKAE